MHEYKLQISSSTLAMKAKRKLSGEGIAVSVVKTTAREGCRYALQVAPTDLMQARRLLRLWEIPYRMGE